MVRTSHRFRFRVSLLIDTERVIDAIARCDVARKTKRRRRLERHLASRSETRGVVGELAREVRPAVAPVAPDPEFGAGSCRAERRVILLLALAVDGRAPRAEPAALVPARVVSVGKGVRPRERRERSEGTVGLNGGARGFRGGRRGALSFFENGEPKRGRDESWRRTALRFLNLTNEKNRGVRAGTRGGRGAHSRPQALHRGVASEAPAGTQPLRHKGVSWGRAQT